MTFAEAHKVLKAAWPDWRIHIGCDMYDPEPGEKAGINIRYSVYLNRKLDGHDLFKSGSGYTLAEAVEEVMRHISQPPEEALKEVPPQQVAV